MTAEGVSAGGVSAGGVSAGGVTAEGVSAEGGELLVFWRLVHINGDLWFLDLILDHLKFYNIQSDPELY